MSLAEFFIACTAAGVSLACRGGGLALRPASAVSPELHAAAVEHKGVLVSLLGDADAKYLADERAAIQNEANVTADDVADALVEWDRVAANASGAWGPWCRFKDHRLGWRSTHGVEV